MFERYRLGASIDNQRDRLQSLKALRGQADYSSISNELSIPIWEMENSGAAHIGKC